MMLKWLFVYKKSINSDILCLFRKREQRQERQGRATCIPDSSTGSEPGKQAASLPAGMPFWHKKYFSSMTPDVILLKYNIIKQSNKTNKKDRIRRWKDGPQDGR